MDAMDIEQRSWLQDHRRDVENAPQAAGDELGQYMILMIRECVVERQQHAVRCAPGLDRGEELVARNEPIPCGQPVELAPKVVDVQIAKIWKPGRCGP